MAQPEYQRGLLRVASRDATVEATRKTNEEQDYGSAAAEAARPVSALVAALNTIWDNNKRSKQDIQTQMVANLRAFRSVYDPAKKADIRSQGGSEAFLGVTRTKCRHAISWLFDVFTSSDRPWAIAPSPKSDPSVPAARKVMEAVQARIAEMVNAGEIDPRQLTPEAMQSLMRGLQPFAEDQLDMEMKVRARKMESQVHDQLVEGGFTDAFRSFIRDLVVLKAGIIKGPIFRKTSSLKWVQDGDTGKYVEKEESVTKPFWYHVSPFDFFPDGYAESRTDLPTVERFRISRAELYELKDEPGYQTECIEKLLNEFDNHSQAASNFGVDSETENIKDVLDIADISQSTSEKAVALEFYVSVSGKKLLDYEGKGLPGAPSKIDPLKDYMVNAILLANELIFLSFIEHPRDAAVYYKTGWDKVNGSFWYDGVPESMEDIQAVCNACARALINNLAVSSGPQVIVDIDRLVAGQDITGIRPFGIWQTVSKGNTSQRQPIEFFSPDSNAKELLAVYDHFAKLADEHTGIPAYSYGNDRVAGAGRTSSGLSMLMSAAARGIKEVVLGIDENVLNPIIETMVNWNMKHSDDESIKGDLVVVASGAVALMVKEQMAARRMEFLNATNNPVDLALIGQAGRANVLREVASSLEIAQGKVVKAPEEVEALEREQEAMQREQLQRQAELEQQIGQLQMANAQMEIQLLQAKAQREAVGGQVDQARVQLEAAKVAQGAQVAQTKLMLDREKMGMDARKAALEHSIKMRDQDSKEAKVGQEGLRLGMEMLGGAQGGQEAADVDALVDELGQEIADEGAVTGRGA